MVEPAILKRHRHLTHMNSDPFPNESTSLSVASEIGFDLDFAQSPKIDAPFPIVGIAASAGGLEAFTELIRHLNRPLFSFRTSSNLVANVDSRKHLTERIVNNFDLGREVDQLISNRYAPVSVVVNDQMDIIQMRGDTNPYLRLSPGTTDLNLLSMAKSGLETALRTAIYQAQTQNISVRQERIQVSSPDASLLLNLEVIPFRPAIVDALYFLVL
jgi:hypothetical protein